MYIHVNLHITGQVQGVGYREAAKKQALSLGLVGYVKNNNDGSVQIMTEGEQRNIDTFVDWCYQGPFLAKVIQVTTSQSPIEGFKGFEVKH